MVQAAAVPRSGRRWAHPDRLHGEAAPGRPPAGASGHGPRPEAGATAVRPHRAHLPAGRGPPAAPRGGQLRGQRRGELSPGHGESLLSGSDADHRPPPGRRAYHQADGRSARPRVRALLPGCRHEAHLRGPPDQPLVLPRGVRARPVGPGPGPCRRGRRLLGRHRVAPGSRLHLAEPADPLRVHARGPRRQLLHAAADGVRRRPLRMPSGRQRHLPRDDAPARGAQPGDQCRLRRAARRLEGAAAAGQPAAVHRGYLRGNAGRRPRRDPPARGRREDRPLRHPPLRHRSHSRRGGSRRAGCRPLGRPGHGAVPGLPVSEPPGHAPLVREGSPAAHPGPQPGGHRDVPSRGRVPARHSCPVRALLRRGGHGLPSDLDRPSGAAAAGGAGSGARRAPIGPRSDEGGRDPGEVRPEAAGADRAAPVRRRERARVVDRGLRDRAGSVRPESRHAGSGGRCDREPGRPEEAERSAPRRVQPSSPRPPAGGAATAGQPFPGAAHRRRAGAPAGGDPARPGAGRSGAGAPAPSPPRQEVHRVAGAPRERRPSHRPGPAGGRRPGPRLAAAGPGGRGEPLHRRGPLSVSPRPGSRHPRPVRPAGCPAERGVGSRIQRERGLPRAAVSPLRRSARAAGPDRRAGRRHPGSGTGRPAAGGGAPAGDLMARLREVASRLGPEALAARRPPAGR